MGSEQTAGGPALSTTNAFIQPALHNRHMPAVELSLLALAITFALAAGAAVIVARGREVRPRDESTSFDLAQRLTGLWRIVNQPGISDPERLQALLDFSTRSLRAGRPFVGLLTHLEEGTVIVDAVALHREGAPGMDAVSTLLAPGKPFPFDATVHRRLFAGGRAQSWDDLERQRDSAPSGALNWRSLLGTTFELGAKRRSWSSARPIRRPTSRCRSRLRLHRRPCIDRRQPVATAAL